MFGVVLRARHLASARTAPPNDRQGSRMGSVIKKRRKRMAKKKHRKLLRKTRHQRRNKK
jgi:mRNA-processing protein COX24